MIEENIFIIKFYYIKGNNLIYYYSFRVKTIKKHMNKLNRPFHSLIRSQIARLKGAA